MGKGEKRPSVTPGLIKWCVPRTIWLPLPAAHMTVVYGTCRSALFVVFACVFFLYRCVALFVSFVGLFFLPFVLSFFHCFCLAILLPAVAFLLSCFIQARLWVDLDMLGLVTGRSARTATRKTKSHNGVVAACALQCLCQLELLRGGR